MDTETTILESEETAYLENAIDLSYKYSTLEVDTDLTRFCPNCGSDDFIFEPLEGEYYGDYLCNVCGTVVGHGDRHERCPL